MNIRNAMSRSVPARVLALAAAVLVLSTCQDFFGTADLKQQIKDDVIDATAPVVTVNIAPPANPSMGAPSPVGSQSWKVGVPYTITTSVGDKYAFAGWTADAGDVTFGNAAEATTTFKVNAAFAGTITVTPTFDTRPKVIYVDPVGNGVPINKTITIKFSENVDPATVSLGTSVLVTTWPTTNPAVDPVAIHSNLGLSISGTLVTLTPSTFYEKYFTVLVTLTPDIRDLEGNPMADDYSWYFATTGTEDSTPPAINSFTIRNAVGTTSVAGSNRAYTNGTSIRLNVSATDDQYQVWKMRIFETLCDSAGNDLEPVVDHGVVGFDSTYDFILANPAEGWTKIQVLVADELDNWTTLTNTAVDTKIVQMDMTRPAAPSSVSASPNLYYGGTYWYRTGSGVAFTPAGAGDGGSGLLGYSTSSDGSGVQTPTLTRGTGTHTIYSVDNAGNVSMTGYGLTVKQDSIGPDAPSITGNNSPYTDESTNPDTYWFITVGVNFSLSGGDNADGSGLKGFTTNSDGSGTQASSLTVGTGTHTIYAVDNVGNVTAGPSVIVKQDNTAPNQPSATPPGGTYQDGDGVYWTTAAAGITFTLSGSDNAGGSGLDHYLIDGTSHPASTTSILLATGAGAHTLYAVDNMGLQSTARSATVKLDNTEPNQPTVTPPAGTYQDGDGVYWTTAAAGITFTLSAADNPGGSGIHHFLIDGTIYPSSTTSILLAPGASAHTLYAVDNMGLQSAVRSVTVKRDSDAPTVTGSDPLTATATTISSFTTAEPGTGSGLNVGSYSVTLKSTGDAAGDFDGIGLSNLLYGPNPNNYVDYNVYVADNAGNSTTITVRLTRDNADGYTAAIP